MESQANSATIICWSRGSFWFFLYKLKMETVHLIEGITLLADWGYDANAILSYAVSAGMGSVIPPKKNRKG